MAKRRPDRVQVFKGRKGRWFFHVVAPNGEVIVPSQGYASAWNAMRAARRQRPTLVIERL